MPVPGDVPAGMIAVDVDDAVIRDCAARRPACAGTVHAIRSATSHADGEQRNHHRGDSQGRSRRSVGIRCAGGGGGGGGSGQSGGGSGGAMVGVDTLRRSAGRRPAAGTMTSVASGDTPSVTLTFQVATVMTNSFCWLVSSTYAWVSSGDEHDLVGTRANGKRLLGRERHGVDQEQRGAGVVERQNRAAVGGFDHVDEVGSLVHGLGDLVGVVSMSASRRRRPRAGWSPSAA